MTLAHHALHPTIAVITAQYFEKVAVDAVMANKQTFVRYATVGKKSIKSIKFSTLFWVTLFVFTFVKNNESEWRNKVYLKITDEQVVAWSKRHFDDMIKHMASWLWPN